MNVTVAFLTADTGRLLRKRFDALISERGKGKDATKLRFVIE